MGTQLSKNMEGDSVEQSVKPIRIDKNRILQFTFEKMIQDCSKKIDRGEAKPIQGYITHVDGRTLEMLENFDRFVYELEMFLMKDECFDFLVLNIEPDDNRELKAKFREISTNLYGSAMYTIFLFVRDMVDGENTCFSADDIPRLCKEEVDRHCQMFSDRDKRLQYLVVFRHEEVTDEMREGEAENDNSTLRQMVEASFDH